ncbi:MAG: transposase family protein [Meiothermus sp.]|nr:transposase family protein [Chloracidobacterium sp.]MCX7782563.1 transposase family protein [Meiothermus sp.]
MNPTQIPSPLPYLAEIPDPREYLKTEHEWENLMLISLMALGSGRTNILAIAHWIRDQEKYLLNTLKLRNRFGQRKLPAQATMYRFFWFLDGQLAALQEAMLAWAQDVLRALGREEALAIATDGKHLRGTRRGRKGEAALVFLSTLVQGLGLSLGSTAVTTSEAKAAEGWLVRMSDLGVDWLITGDAGVMSPTLAQQVVAQKGATSSRSRVTRKTCSS